MMVAAVVAMPAAARETTGLLHPLFRDHAVLQRDRPIAVWGHAGPGQPVSVTFAGQAVSTRADAAGGWQATLSPMAAGGPHTLEVIAGTRRERVRDVLVGDVWLCSGQSNMELPVWRSLNAASEIAAATMPRIRLFTVPQHAAAQAQESFNDSTAWTSATPDAVRDFSATCFYFARELQRTVDVPMGLIEAAWGGSRIEAWTSVGALRGQGGLDEALDILARSARDPLEARAAWGRYWQHWWATREGTLPGDAPWRADADDRGWSRAPATLGAWERWNEPALADYNGMVWYRTQVVLSAEQAARGATLELASADEVDVTWVNGVAVGSQYGAGKRRYPLPRGLLKAGSNVIAVNVLDTYGEGGLAGPATAYGLQFDDGERVALQGPWKYRVAPGQQAPPFAPWQAATGLSTLYNGMIAPLGGVGLRGMLWYQGESNTGEGATYALRLRALRDDWRRQFGARLPLLLVQLAGYGQPPVAPADSGWAQVREAQRRVAAEDAQSGLAIAIDIGDAYDIHPPNKQELGRRLARVARHVVYGEQDVAPSGPRAVTAVRTPAGVAIAFEDVDGTLTATGAVGPIGFEFCGSERDTRHCDYGDAELDGRRILLRGPRSTHATHVRYCWADGPVCTLRDRSGAPAGPFELPIAEAEARR
ncbi:sialate O-acetylesterase [Stenotrophomonas maltophilia]|uniref:sialate O-acetylesterase n=1 Tax=Stenotrophomonas maltophilia TaxID=40324 RepID=UPI000C15F2EA|nr:sialate O-acetylesterase [Stenotrophomonas maltophilia]HDS1548778.1 9-O-acetylesterase [Stenotrophomonas maltophilia]